MSEDRKQVPGGGRRRRHNRVTAGDVAERAGVSMMTVSRVVNGDPRVRPANRKAVEAAIKTLGYSPNKAARSLASAQTMQVCLLYANPGSAFLAPMLIGVLEQAQSSDSRIVVQECAPGPAVGEAIRKQADLGIEGFVLAPPLCDSRQAFEELALLGLPAITIGSDHQQQHISSLRIDDVAAARELVKHLVGKGHRRIAMIRGDANQSATRDRERGFHEAMDEAGLPVPAGFVVGEDFSYRKGLEVAGELLKQDPQPTAIICCNDDLAAGAMAAAQRERLRVPGDLSVVGFDDTAMATTVWPGITTVRQPISRMSRVAIEWLEQDIRRLRNGQDSKPIHQLFEFELAQRGSVTAPRY